MKFYLLVAFVMLIFSSTVHAALTDWNVDISVNDDGSNDWIVTLTYNATVTKSDYFVLAKLYNVEVYANNQSIMCDVTEDLGMSIVCNNIEASEIVYKFHTKKFVDTLPNNMKMFKYSFSVTQFVDRMHVTLRLPLGTALVEESKLSRTGLRSFDPDFGREGTDGRRIFISWTFDKPILGQSINAYAIYEAIFPIDQFTFFVIIITAIIVAFISFLIMLSRKQKVRDILPVLTDGERKVMIILLREKGTVDQRTIVKETDFSKAKVTRVINDLVARGIIEKISRGRKNLIKLKKEVKRAENFEDNRKEEKRHEGP
jgi:uncharacterized membrane protein